MPTGNPPHKQCKTDSHHRLEMLKQAIENCDTNKSILVDSFEIDRSGKTYFVDNLKHILEKYSFDEIAVLVCADHAQTISRWKNFEFIAQNVKLAIASRNNIHYDKSLFSYELDSSNFDVSSTQLRKLLQDNKYDSDYVKLWLPVPVTNYIINNNLY